MNNRFCKKYSVGDTVLLINGYTTRTVKIMGFNSKGYYNAICKGKMLAISDFDIEHKL